MSTHVWMAYTEACKHARALDFASSAQWYTWSKRSVLLLPMAAHYPCLETATVPPR